MVTFLKELQVEWGVDRLLEESLLQHWPIAGYNKNHSGPGSWEQILWLFEYYGKEKVSEAFLEDYYGLRSMPESTRKLWELIFVEKPAVQKASPVEKWRCRRKAGERGPGKDIVSRQ